MNEHGLRVAARTERARRAERVFRRDRRRQVIGELHVQTPETCPRRLPDSCSRSKPGANDRPSPAGPTYDERIAVRVADVGVARELHRVVFARVLRERRLQNGVAVAVHVVCRAQARHEARTCPGDCCPVVASLAACSNRMPTFSVSRRRHDPAILHVRRGRRLVEHGAAMRNPALDAGKARNEHRNRMAVGVLQRARRRPCGCRP